MSIFIKYISNSLYRLFSGPKVDMANLLANMSNLIMCAFFFCPLIPLSIPICFFGLIFGYIVEKVYIFINLNMFIVCSFKKT